MGFEYESNLWREFNTSLGNSNGHTHQAPAWTLNPCSGSDPHVKQCLEHATRDVSVLG